MKFMTMEDLTGIYDTVLFPNVYEKVAAMTLSYGPYCLEGVVEPRYSTVNVSRIELLDSKSTEYTFDEKIVIDKQLEYAKQKSCQRYLRNG